MKRFALAITILCLTGATLTGRSALAANADQPYQNVNKSNDAGNNTGNPQVDHLNSSQLDENQKAPSASK